MTKNRRTYAGAAAFALIFGALLVIATFFDLEISRMLTRGVLIRHLVLPGHLPNTFGVIDRVRKMFPQDGQTLFSLMSQFTPVVDVPQFPELCRRLLEEEYTAAEQYLFDSGIEDGFVQDRESADTEYIPAFDGTGV